jgi:hypothetical protein
MGASEKASASKVALPPTGSTKNDCRGATLKYVAPASGGTHGSWFAAARAFDHTRCATKTPSLA